MINFDYPHGATPLDPNEIEGLKLTHITTRSELDRWEQDNILEALHWLESTRPKDILNEQFIRKLHRKMFGDDAAVWIGAGQMPPDEMAARLHHRLVSIHPFSNGNGRHARLMADLLLETVLRQPRFSWGSKNLARAGDARSIYISALRAADRFDMNPLVKFARS